MKGGGLYIENSSGKFSNLAIEENKTILQYSYGHGGGICFYNCNNVTFEKSRVERNQGNCGGGISVDNSSIIIDSVLIKNNNAKDSFNSGSGGGLYILQGQSTVSNVTVCNNNSAGGGGGIQFMWAKGDFNNIKILFNSGGGAFFAYQGGKFRNFIIANNYNTAEGGGIVFYNAGVTIENFIIQGNKANKGGGIAVLGDMLYKSFVKNCSIIENKANSYGGVFAFSTKSSAPEIEFTSCNFSHNDYGIYNNVPGVTMSAKNNYWGKPSGPYHPFENTMGQGDSVNVFVDANPWLTSPDIIAPPIPPFNNNVTSTNNNSIHLSWNPSPISDLAGYKVYYAKDSSGYPYENYLDVGNTTDYTLSNLTIGQKYYMAVTAYDKDGNESWYSNEVSASTTPAPRISADLSSIDFGTVDVRSNNAKSFKITNTGTAALNLKTIQMVNTSFGYSLNTRKLEPGTSTTFIALFSPKSTGAYKVDLKIVSDAANDSILVIPITGHAVLPKAPFIVSVNDVPNDQGGQVRITFQPSRYDGVDSLQKVSSYSVWRKIDENKWDAVNQFNAVGDSIYYVVAPSLGDSTVNGVVWSTYKVTAHTTDPLLFYTSEPSAGYSRDNIAPEVPKGFTASVTNNRVYLKWNSSKEKDFQYYAIYRSTDPNFSADTMKKYTYTTIDTAYVDNNVSMNQKYYYKIAAMDYAGNRSTSTNAEIAVLSDVNDEGKAIPKEYSLEQNFPNPFNPSTVIRYSLPYESRVKVSIFNSLGQLVNELVDKIEASGNYEKAFNAGNLPSGIYIYSISVQSTDGKNSFSSVKKMMLVK
ncbi:MAG: choice-of-anchor D domain-containing protein [Syntrophothermus sp.]